MGLSAKTVSKNKLVLVTVFEAITSSHEKVIDQFDCIRTFSNHDILENRSFVFDITLARTLIYVAPPFRNEKQKLNFNVELFSKYLAIGE